MYQKYIRHRHLGRTIIIIITSDCENLSVLCLSTRCLIFNKERFKYRQIHITYDICVIIATCVGIIRSYLQAINIYLISWPIRRTVIFSLEILEQNNDECILILVIYWKKTGLLHTKISKHNIIYSS